MAFQFHHRKLFDDDSPPDPCKLSCDILLNSTTACLPPCDIKCLTCLPCPPPPPPISPLADLDKPRQLSLLLIASLAVLATAFFLFTCYIIYKFYIIWRNSSRRSTPPQRRLSDEEDFLNEDQTPVVDHPIWYIRTLGLQQSEINAITIVKYKRVDGLVEGTDCAICLSEFEEDETLRLLPKCNHAFHIPCIDTWLGSHTNCPMCRAGIVSSAASPPSEPVALDSEPARSESVRVGSDGGGADQSQTGAGMNEDVEWKVNLGGLELDDGVQGVRRSVSMDSLSASMISAAIANAFPQRSAVKVKDGGKGVVEMQRGSSSIKRSASCSASIFIKA